MDFKTKPYEHQEECFNLIKDKPYYALFLEPGLGKTKIALDVITYRKCESKNYRALVVCPNTITENWLQEICTHSNLQATTLTGGKKRRLVNLSHEKDLYIINYEGVSTIKDALEQKKFDLLVLDESHYVKSHKSIRSKACFVLSKTIPHRLLLTGTPVMNNPLDIFAQFRCLNPVIFGNSFYRFRAYYAVMGGYGNYQVIKWINMNIFKRRLFSCAVRKTKEECLDLPEQLYQTIKVVMPDEQKEVYKSLKDHFIAEYRDSPVVASVVLTRLIRFSQITAGFTKDVEGVEHAFTKNPKINWLVEFISNLDNTRQLVVFTRFRREISMLEQELRNNDINFVSLHGDTTERLDKINKFNNDNSIKVFITNTATGGLGINLTAATYAVFLTNDYSYGNRVQAEDRIHRIGQDKNVTYIDVLMEHSIDSSIHRILNKKQSLSDMVMKDIIRMV